MKSARLISKTARLALGALIGALMAANFAHLFLDRSPMTFDALYYYNMAYNFRLAFMSNADSVSWPVLHNALFDAFRPPLLGVLGGLALMTQHIIENPTIAVVPVQLLFYPLLVASVFAVARRIGPLESAFVAFAAAFVVATSPGIVAFSKAMMTDLPLAAAVWAAIAALLASDRFRKLGASLGFGVACGVGLLVKQPFPLFVAVPAAAIAVQSWQRKDRRGRMAAGMVLAGAAAAAIALPWYLLNFQGSLRAHLTAADNNIPTDLSHFALRPFFSWIWDWELGWLFALLAAAGAVRLAIRKSLRKRYLPFVLFGLASLVPPLLFFSASANKQFRFVLPIVPFFALVLALGLFGQTDHIWRRPRFQAWAKPAAAALTIAVGLAQFAFNSFAPLPWQKTAPRDLTALPDPSARSPLEEAFGTAGFNIYRYGSHLGLYRMNRLGMDGLMLYSSLLAQGSFGPKRKSPARILVLDDGGHANLAGEMARLCKLDGAACEVILMAYTGKGLELIDEKDNIKAWADVCIAWLPCYQCRSPQLRAMIEDGYIDSNYNIWEGLSRDGDLSMWLNPAARPDAAPPAGVRVPAA